MRPSIHCDLVNGPFGDPVVYADVMFARRALLFDIGDIASLPARKLLRVSDIFVSHAHMDHFAGFDRLLRLLLGRDRTVAVYGPAGFIDKVEHKLHAFTWNVVATYAGSLAFVVSEVHDRGTLRQARFRANRAFRREPLPDIRFDGDILSSRDGLIVRGMVLDHATPCLGFALQEPAHVNVWKARLERLGLAVGPWLRELKHAILIGAPDDTRIHAWQSGRLIKTMPLADLRDVATVTAGQKIAYVVDVRNTDANAERIERLASGADLLFVECAFLEADAEHAARKNHLTAWQAGTLAARAQVKRIVPCHFSTRYTGRGDALLQEACAAFAAGGNRARNSSTIADSGAAASSANS
jgi:ribonuclease Z